MAPLFNDSVTYPNHLIYEIFEEQKEEEPLYPGNNIPRFDSICSFFFWKELNRFQQRTSPGRGGCKNYIIFK